MAEQNSNTEFLRKYPVMISLAFIHEYPPKPLIDVLENPRARMVNKKKSTEVWSQQVENIYLPLLRFLLTHQIAVSAVITGNFLDFTAKHHPEVVDIIRTMVDQKLMYVVADAYWGTSHLNLYYFDWWKDEVEGTSKSIQRYFGFDVDSVYIPLVFRSLPLERLTHEMPIRRFVSTKRQRKAICYETNLREFRRFHGGKVNWIEDKDNVDIEILYYPQRMFYHMMDIRTSKDPNAVLKTRSMDIGLRSSRVATDIRIPGIQRTSIRISEDRPVSSYHVLQQATIRLWEYVTFILGKEHAEIDTIDDDPLMQSLFYVMHRDFLFYLEPSNYSKKRDMPFSSPYEAFVHVQNVVFQLETLLNKK